VTNTFLMSLVEVADQRLTPLLIRDG
jgi:hypothetical protein